MDRQDIDALLIGALYGELTPADEARLAAHLESHPADRGALDDLKSARAKIAESRIFELQAEPPQHISALLLQEAHRKAPKRAVAVEGEEKESWFWRFARSFMAHPAMAAAAMLVVVLGVAGTLYMKKGEHFAERSAPADQQVATTQAETAPANTAIPPAAAEGSAAYQADLYEGDKAQGLANSDEAAPSKDTEKADSTRVTGTKAASNGIARNDSASTTWRKEESSPPSTASTTTAAKNKGIIVSTEQPEPKDFDRERKAASHTSYGVADTPLAGDLDGVDDAATGAAKGRPRAATGGAGGGAGTGVVVGGASRGAPGAVAPAGPMAQPPPPPAVAETRTQSAKAPAKVEAKPEAPAEDKKVAVQKTDKAAAPAPTATPTTSAQAQDSTLVAWAKQQHQRSIALAKSGDCKSAAQVALVVSNRAPDYYASYMATDRSLKGCKQYIEAERERAAESKKASRATPTQTTK